MKLLSASSRWTLFIPCFPLSYPPPPTPPPPCLAPPSLFLSLSHHCYIQTSALQMSQSPAVLEELLKSPSQNLGCLTQRGQASGNSRLAVHHRKGDSRSMTGTNTVTRHMCSECPRQHSAPRIMPFTRPPTLQITAVLIFGWAGV